MQENEITNTTTTDRKANREEKYTLCNELRDILEPLEITPETLDLRELKNIKTITDIITKRIETRDKYLKKVENIVYTVSSLAEEANMARETIQRSKSLMKVIKAIIPEEQKKVKHEQKDDAAKTLRLLLKEKTRKEREGEKFYDKVKIELLLHENEVLKSQAETEKLAREMREERIRVLEDENRKLNEAVSLNSTSVRVKLMEELFKEENKTS